MNDKEKTYKAILLSNPEITEKDRITIRARSLKEAEEKLKEEYGADIRYSLYSEEDANRIR